MQYTLSDKILPVYHRDNYEGSHQLIHKNQKGYAVLEPNVIEALHYHSYAEIGICLCGSGVTHVDDRIYSYSSGDLQFVPPGVPHLSTADPGVQTHWCWLSVDLIKLLEDSGHLQMNTLRSLSGQGFSGVFHAWEHPRLAEILHAFQRTALSPDEHSAMESAFLAGQLIIECARIGKEKPGKAADKSSARKLKPAMEHIRENFADKEQMREERIAGLCGMSVSHFRAVFKKETGMAVRDFIIQTRLAKAAHLLKSTDASIMSIALESGFGQISCFNRIFSRTFGQTPSAFRKRSKLN